MIVVYGIILIGGIIGTYYLWGKKKPEPNYRIRAYGITSFGSCHVSVKEVFARSKDHAIRKAKILAWWKEREIGWRYHNFSMYEDGSYPNSIGVEWSISKLN